MSVHKLVSETLGDVLVFITGKSTSGLDLTTSDVILPGGKLCSSHGIPDYPITAERIGFTSVGDYMIVGCGGYSDWTRTDGILKNILL